LNTEVSEPIEVFQLIGMNRGKLIETLAAQLENVRHEREALALMELDYRTWKYKAAAVFVGTPHPTTQKALSQTSALEYLRTTEEYTTKNKSIITHSFDLEKAEAVVEITRAIVQARGN